MKKRKKAKPLSELEMAANAFARAYCANEFHRLEQAHSVLSRPSANKTRKALQTLLSLVTDEYGLNGKTLREMLVQDAVIAEINRERRLNEARRSEPGKRAELERQFDEEFAEFNQQRRFGDP